MHLYTRLVTDVQAALGGRVLFVDLEGNEDVEVNSVIPTITVRISREADDLEIERLILNVLGPIQKQCMEQGIVLPTYDIVRAV